MRPPPRTWRVALAVVGVGALASCSAPAGTRASTRADRAPVVAVAHGRFVADIDLDGGELTVEPPPSSAHPGLSLAAATTLFRAADAVEGTYDFSVVGLAVVTLTPPGSAPPTTVHSVFPTTTAAAGGGLAAPPTPAGSPGATSSTSSTSTSPSASPSSTSGSAGSGASSTTSALPTYQQRLAWVGMAWNGACPDGPTSGTSTSGTLLEPGGLTRYTVVLFAADTGKDALAYTSRGPASCGGPVVGPTMARPEELASVAWAPVGPTSTAVQVDVPACGSYDGWTELAAPSAGTLEVLAKVPYDPECGSGATSQVVPDVVPLGAGAQAVVPHAPLGPVAAEHTLPGGDGGGRAQTALAG